jgi:Tol biopolymer transport system component
MRIPAVLALGLVLAAAGPATAAFPGINGLIAWERDSQILVKNFSDVSAGTPLTNLGSNEDPAWSPDGTRIAFVSNRLGAFDVWVMNADGSGQTRVTFETVDAQNPAWSPDGGQIAFDGNNVGNQDIVVVNANGSGRRVVAGGGNIQSAPAWSADGSRIVFRDFSQGTGLSIVNADGSGRTPLIADANRPDVSPDGRRIAFSRGDEVFVANADGSGAAPVTTLTGAQPAFSPDGKLIVYTRSTAANPPPSNFELFTVGTGGGAQITETLTAAGVTDWEPDWQAIGPPPDITALSGSLVAGRPATLVVDGTGFVRRSVVRWNGADRPTTFVSATRLTASLSAADLPAPGTAQVNVFTSPTGGGLSLPRTATIAPPPPPPPAPRITLASATIRAKWRRSRVRGSLTLKGAAERAGRVQLALLRGPGARARVLQSRPLSLPLGAFTRRVKLKRSLLPGVLRVRLREVGAVTGPRLVDATRTVRLRAPVEGVVSKAFVSTLQRGPAARSVRSPRRVFAHFRFAARPKGGRPLTATWRLGGRAVGVVGKPFSGTVIAPLGLPGGLPPGSYRCELRAGRRVVAVAAIRVR